MRKGGITFLSGVYGGTASSMPLLTMFDKQINYGWAWPTFIAGVRRMIKRFCSHGLRTPRASWSAEVVPRTTPSAPRGGWCELP